MHKFTQNSYDMIMDYVGLNQRAMGLLSTTKHTGLVRWHKRNHEIYDKFNEWITKWIGNYYDEYATPKMVETFNYMLQGKTITPHLQAWYGALMPMKKATMDMYEEAKSIGDGVLACKFFDLNKTIVNECFELKRLLRRLENETDTGYMIINKIIHDEFEKHPECEWIDLSL